MTVAEQDDPRRFRAWRDRLIVVGDEAFLPDEFEAITHGTSGGYVHWQCRCPECCDWHRAYYGRKPR